MRFIYGLILIGVGFVFYLSWVPSPKLEYLWFMPNWLTRWTDLPAHEDSRTGVPFVFLGLFAGLLARNTHRFLYRLVMAWLILVGVVVIAEAGQLVLPHRVFRWADIGWGAAGAFAGLLVAGVFIGISNRYKRNP